jgi:hypothetical protein
MYDAETSNRTKLVGVQVTVSNSPDTNLKSRNIWISYQEIDRYSPALPKSDGVIRAYTNYNLLYPILFGTTDIKLSWDHLQHNENFTTGSLHDVTYNVYIDSISAQYPNDAQPSAVLATWDSIIDDGEVLDDWKDLEASDANYTFSVSTLSSKFFVFNVIATGHFTDNEGNTRSIRIPYAAFPLYIRGGLLMWQDEGIAFGLLAVIIIGIAASLVFGLFLVCYIKSCFTMFKIPAKERGIHAPVLARFESVIKHARTKRDPMLSLYKIVPDYCTGISDLHFEALAHLQHITKLNLGHCHLDSLPGELFVSLWSLDSLYVSHNALSTLPNGLTNVESLKVLDASHNMFMAVPDCVLTMSSLVTVDFSQNKIRKFPDVSLMENLKIIKLTDNRLTSIDASLTKRSNVAVQVRGNPLVTLPPLLITPSDVVISYTGYLFPRTLVVPYWILGLPLWNVLWLAAIDIAVLGLIGLIVLLYYFIDAIPIPGDIITFALVISFLALLLIPVATTSLVSFWKMSFIVHPTHSFFLMLQESGDDRNSAMMDLVKNALMNLTLLIVDAVQLCVLAFSPGSPFANLELPALQALFSVFWFQFAVEIELWTFAGTIFVFVFVFTYRFMFEFLGLVGGAMEPKDNAGLGFLGWIFKKFIYGPMYIIEMFRGVFDFMQDLSAIVFMPVIMKLSSNTNCNFPTGAAAYYANDPSIQCGSPVHLLIIFVSLFCITIYLGPSVLSGPIWQEKDKGQLVRFTPLYLIFSSLIKFILSILISPMSFNTVLFSLLFVSTTGALLVLALMMPAKMMEIDTLNIGLAIMPLWAAMLTLIANIPGLSKTTLLYIMVFGIIAIIVVCVIALTIVFTTALIKYAVERSLADKRKRLQDEEDHKKNLEKMKAARKAQYELIKQSGQAHKQQIDPVLEMLGKGKKTRLDWRRAKFASIQANKQKLRDEELERERKLKELAGLDAGEHEVKEVESESDIDYVAKFKKVHQMRSQASKLRRKAHKNRRVSHRHSASVYSVNDGTDYSILETDADTLPPQTPVDMAPCTVVSPEESELQRDNVVIPSVMPRSHSRGIIPGAISEEQDAGITTSNAAAVQPLLSAHPPEDETEAVRVANEFMSSE